MQLAATCGASAKNAETIAKLEEALTEEAVAEVIALVEQLDALEEQAAGEATLSDVTSQLADVLANAAEVLRRNFPQAFQNVVHNPLRADFASKEDTIRNRLFRSRETDRSESLCASCKCPIW
jgi:aromatic ring hydroxylase